MKHLRRLPFIFQSPFWNKGVNIQGPGKAFQIIPPSAFTIRVEGEAQLNAHYTSEFCSSVKTPGK